MAMIPCEDCLILPICKHKKREVVCSKLFDWYWYRESYVSDEAATIKKYLPLWNFSTLIRKETLTIK